MFKVRAVHAEKVQEIQAAIEVQNESVKDANDLEGEQKSDEDVVRSALKSSQPTNSGKVVVSIKPSNFEKGYESDLY